jgi:mono/diheme cytochrome c family protein
VHDSRVPGNDTTSSDLTLRRGLVASIAVAGVAAIGVICVALAQKPSIPAVTPAPAASFAVDLVARGAALAAIGDCAVCHTAKSGRPFAGGRPVTTPFGVIYSTNITPDADTGIGAWSEQAFRRSLREGVDRDGQYLYPAFPYPHFTHATDQDIEALYAFLMTRAPVSAKPPPDAVVFPLNIRMLLAGWDWLFLRSGVWQPRPSRSADENRGAYLVETLGHCGACHTPLDVLGAEQRSKAFRGGEAEGWDAPALQAATPARAPWTVESLTDYLRNGFTPGHGAAAGPMREVTDELARAPVEDVRAIAVYFVSLMGGATAKPTTRAIEQDAVFDGACAGCHAPGSPSRQLGAPSLAAGAAVNAPSPRDAIQTILKGIPWREGRAGPFMPGFAAELSDRQVAHLVEYLRASFGNGPAWTDVEKEVRRARDEGGS